MIKNLIYGLIAISLFAGCAKNRDVERQKDRPGRDSVEDVQAKKTYIAPNPDGTRGVWLGKMTVIDTSDSPAGSLFVGFQGDVQVGYFDFNQYQMQFRSLKGMQEGVESENIKNPVLMNWNVDHIDYALDEKDGQTTNTEIESDFKTWDKKRFFKVRWADQKDIANSVQMFPSTASTFFGCWKPVNFRRVPGSVDTGADHINFKIEVVYQINLLNCGAAAAQWAEGDLNFTATFMYSFRKLEPSSYKPKFYSNEQDPARYKYGHFQTVRKVLNPNDSRPHNVFMENRWAEKTQHFYFVKGFPQKYKWIWDHNQPQSVLGQTNALLKSVGSKLRFEIHDFNYNHKTGQNDAEGREFGDIRYSFVNFIEQLEAGGTPFGYGPSDTNPFTGEIIAANTMVWTGMLDYYMKLMEDVGKNAEEESSLFVQMNRSLDVSANEKVTIDQLVNDWDQTKGVGKLFKHMAQENRFGLSFWNSYTSNEAGEVVVPTVVDLYNDIANSANQDPKDLAQSFLSSVVDLPLDQSNFRFETRFLNGRPQAKVINAQSVMDMSWASRVIENAPTNVPVANIREVLKALETIQSVPNAKVKYNLPRDLKTLAKEHFDHQHRLVDANMHGHCMIDMDEFASGFAGFLKATNLNIQDPEVRQDVLNTVLYRVSIHEFGHNLNLRHNFYGSVDKENFGLEKDSSIAAFKGANRMTKFTIDNRGQYKKVEGKREQVSSSVMDYLRLEDEVGVAWSWEDYDVAAILDSYAPKGFDDKGHLYLFCTDEHTATSAICNRHDLGTTPSQILMSQIRSYDERYEMRNKRYGRAYWNTSGYAGGMFETMMSFKEFVPLWRTGLAEDMLRNKLSELGVKNNDLQTAQVEAIDREMINVMKMSMAFFDGVIQQSRGTRDFRSEYDPVTGALKYMGIMPDKIFAMMFLAGDDAIFYNPNRIMNHNSYLTYSGSPEIAQYSDRLWRNILTSRQIAMEPWFINFSRMLYAKNATNYNNRGAASLINSMKIIKIDNSEDLMDQYGIEMDTTLPTLQTRLPKATTGTFDAGEEVVVIHIDGAYYMTSIAEGDVTYTLFQEALDAVTGAGDDDQSITQFNMDVIEFHWLYNLARSGSLQ